VAVFEEVDSGVEGLAKEGLRVIGTE